MPVPRQMMNRPAGNGGVAKNMVRVAADGVFYLFCILRVSSYVTGPDACYVKGHWNAEKLLTRSM